MASRRRLIQTPAAEDDILEIYESIAVERPKAAIKLLARIDEAIERIRQFPDLNIERPDFAIGLRVLKVPPYLLFYQSRPDEVLIVRVLHGARDIGDADFA